MINYEYLELAKALPDEDPCKEYLVEVFSGNILVGNLVFLSLTRHMDDMRKSSSDDFVYYYNYKEAKFAIDFMEKFGGISKGTTSVMKFTPWQRFIQASLFGWLTKGNDLRRFREALVLVARKNGRQICRFKTE